MWGSVTWEKSKSLRSVASANLHHQRRYAAITDDDSNSNHFWHKVQLPERMKVFFVLGDNILAYKIDFLRECETGSDRYR